MSLIKTRDGIPAARNRPLTQAGGDKEGVTAPDPWGIPDRATIQRPRPRGERRAAARDRHHLKRLCEEIQRRGRVTPKPRGTPRR
ncbi:MAG: hypothetical protein OXE84_07750 [Rhodobacteraceae bacterium]|nr:hypothetical protein [Paracoccaceae bacterium]